MAMLSFCTALLSRAPAPRKSSPAAALQLHGRQPAAAASVAALRWASSNESRSRAAVFACHAADKYSYNIDRDALLLRTTPPKLAGDDWEIVGNKDLFILKLKVGEATSKAKLKVEAARTSEDPARLVVKYTGDPSDDSPATSLDADLTVPPDYDHKNVHAKMFDGWLIIAIAKPTHDPSKVFFDDKLGKFYYDHDKVAIE